MNKHVNLSIRGKVHGVGFRFSCMEAAYRFGVTGFVKNKKDGSVYVEAEGPEENLQSFVEWCHKGPTWSRITKVEIEQGDIQNFKSFEIVR